MQQYIVCGCQLHRMDGGVHTCMHSPEAGPGPVHTDVEPTGPEGVSEKRLSRLREEVEREEVESIEREEVEREEVELIESGVNN